MLPNVQTFDGVLRILQLSIFKNPRVVRAQVEGCNKTEQGC